MESLFRRLRNVSVSAPRVEVVVERKAWQDLQSGFRGIGGDAIKVGMTQHLACDDHGLFLDEINLVFLLHHLSPCIDLLMNVDLHWTDVRATAIQSRGKREFTVTADVESRHHDDSHKAHVRRALAKAAPGTGDRTGGHAGGTPEALERWPELLHSKARRAAIVYRDS